MLVCFPTPMPGELFYSMIGRYFQSMGEPSPKSMLIDLFGNPSVIASVDMPAHLGSLIERLPFGSKITAERLVWEHTLFPIYTAFLPMESKKTIYESMVNGNGKGITTRSGLMASSIRFNAFFRFCSLCFREDIQEKYGFSYWYRIHQMPGMDVCLKHGTWLRNSRVLIQQENRHLYIPPSDEVCSLDEPVAFITDSRTLELYRLFGNQVEKLLNLRFVSQPLQWFENQYLTKLQKLGFASASSGRVDQEKLRVAFIEFYGEGFLQNMQSSLIEKDNWLGAITRRHRKSFHPIRHILLMNFLNITLEELFAGDISFKPFGEGPWSCHNPAADHYTEKTISDVSLSTCDKTKRIIGIFKCKCGYAYTRKVGDEDSKFKTKQFGSVWELECKRLNQEGLSLREIGRRLHADPMTVKKYLRIQEKNDLKQLPQYVADKMNWLQLCKDNPRYSKKQLRELDSALYARLYRNAKSWLMENSPEERQQSKGQEKRIDWISRDLDLLDIVKAAVDEIQSNEGKPKRLSVSRIGTAVGKRALLEKHIDKLPMTKAYLNLIVDDDDTFRLRRIKWAVGELEREGKKIMKWEVLKRAGIRPEYVSDEMWEEAFINK